MSHRVLRFSFLAGLALVLGALALVRTLRAAAPPAVGTIAPDFALPDEAHQTIRLSSLRGHWVVLYFYPKDFTSGCTMEAHNFQRDLKQYERLNAVIVGVSVQSAASHASFCAKEGLHFKLLADKGGRVSKMYGSMMTVMPLAARHTFLIDPHGKIVKRYLHVDPRTHSPEVLRDLKIAEAHGE